MATILTVHGTGSSGPESGERWWQKGSPFEAHLRELVAPKDGEFRYQPVMWDGDNSESCRRTAAKKLASHIVNLEKAKEPYIVIAHSHGGSIIANMVQDNLNPSDLTHLSGVITIGTPYLTFRRGTLFSSLGLFGKSMLVFATLIAALSAIVMILAIHDYPTIPTIPTIAEAAGAVLLIVAWSAPFLLFTIIVRVIKMNRFRRYTKRVQQDCLHALAHRWVCLFDRNDEAILGLGCVRRIKLRLFTPHFAVPALSLASLFVFSLFLLIAAASPSIMRFINNQLGWLFHASALQPSGDLPIGDFKNNILYLFALSIYAIYFFIHVTGGPLEVWGKSGPLVLWTGIVLAGSGALLVVYFLSFLATLVVRQVSIGISTLLSRVLDLVTWNAIRRRVFGSDLAGEAAVDAFAYPVWMPSGNNPIPQPLSDELTRFVNQEAIKSLPKLRQTVYELAFSIGAGKPANFIQNYLSWNEILHTSYFNIPHFRMLVGFVISKANGFHATQAFKDNRDFEVVAQWFDEIEGKRK